MVSTKPSCEPPPPKYGPPKPLRSSTALKLLRALRVEANREYQGFPTNFLRDAFVVLLGVAVSVAHASAKGVHPRLFSAIIVQRLWQ